MVDCNREETIRCKIHMTEGITLWKTNIAIEYDHL
jgi:hypothetical protein